VKCVLVCDSRGSGKVLKDNDRENLGSGTIGLAASVRRSENLFDQHKVTIDIGTSITDIRIP
jgi:hypothetical protein